MQFQQRIKKPNSFMVLYVSLMQAEKNNCSPGCLCKPIVGVACQQVYHISRNFWSKLETRTVKNVCAPAAVIEDKIYIIGGELCEKIITTVVVINLSKG